jgi:arylsulfatase A-like enzyme
LTGGAPRRRTARAVAAGALAAVAFAGCGAPRPTFDRVVLVTLDTTRADHLGAYGYPRATTPFLDTLAARGTLFERAIAPIPTTVPSHATMFTSRYPLELGVGHNGQRLPGGVPTAAEMFRDGGFATAGFVSLQLLQQSGLRRGFDLVGRRDAASDGVERPPDWGSDGTTDAAIDWLREQRRDGRFFLWVHYYDAHHPYRSPSAVVDSVRRDSVPIEAVESRLAERHGIGLAIYDGDRRARLDTVERYDAELREMDDKLRRLYTAAEELGFVEGSIWVIVGDHGEGLGSHDWMQHGVRIYQEQLRVPLVVHAPGAGWPARRVDEVVELTDLPPTFAELAGLPPPEGVRGRSLAPWLRGEAPPESDREALAQRRTFTGERPAREAAPATAFGELWEDGDRLALVGRRWKYLHWTAGPPELYDLESDPTESRNLAESEPERVAAMRERLLSRARELRSLRLEAESVDERTLEMLRSLGYVQ